MTTPLIVLPKNKCSAEDFIATIYEPALFPFLKSLTNMMPTNQGPILMEDGATVHTS